MTTMRSRVGLLAMMALAGCATGGPTTEVGVTGMPNAEVALRRSMDQVNQHMTQLGGLGRPIASGRAAVVPAELQRSVAFVWTGPLAEGVRRLADSVGYSVVVSGVERPQPVQVTVNLPATTLVEAFAALGDQAGVYATVQLDPTSRTVQVVHHV